MDTFLQDLRYTCRSLRKSPVFTVVAVLTLALGIGAVTIMFSVLEGTLLRPLPVVDQGRAVILWKADPAARFDHIPFSHPAFRAIREQSHSFESIAGIDYGGPWPFTVEDGGEPTLVKGGVVSGDFFGVLGVNPILGRALRAGDDVAGGARVLVISHGLWQQRFGSDPGIIGRRLDLWGTSYEIVGVMAPGFEYPKAAALWVPSALLRPRWEEDHQYWNLDLVARLKPGIGTLQALAELNTIVRRLETIDPDGGRNYHVIARPFADMIVGDVRPGILILSGAALLVLLIAGANVAGLMIVRGASRRREFSIRLALGAERERIARQTITEATVIALGAGLLALVLCTLGIRAFVAFMAPQLPRSEGLGVNTQVLGFTLGVSFITVMLLSVVPVLRGGRADRDTPLVGGRAPFGAGDRPSGRRVLVVAQVALTLLVLSSAGLLVRSLSRLQVLDLGFDPEHLVTMLVGLPPMGRDPGMQRLHDLIAHAVARIEGVPGVVAATPVLVPAFSGTAGFDLAYTAEGQSQPQMAANPILNYEAVAPNYFGTLGIKLRQGRVVTDRDREDALPIVVVNQQLARLTWPGEDPIGKRLKWGDPAAEGPWRTVVGVVGNTRYRELAAIRPTAYVPYRQAPELPVHVVVRSRSGDGDIVPAVRRALRETEPGLNIVEASTLAELLSVPLAQPRFIALLAAIFAALALVLAVVGLYGVIASIVVHRTREIAVRVALGARPGDVRWLVLRQGMVLAVVGVGIGLATALATTQILASVLYQVSPTDPATLTAAVAMLLLVSALASYIPARRATRVDPMMALRSE